MREVPLYVRALAAWPFDKIDKWLRKPPFRGGLVFKAHRLLYHSTLGLRVIKKKKKPLFKIFHGNWPLCVRNSVQGYLAQKKTPAPRTTIGP